PAAHIDDAPPPSSFPSPSPVATPLPRPAAHSNDTRAPFLLPISVFGLDPLPRHAAHIDPISLLDSETAFSSSSDNDTGEASAATAPSFPELEAVVGRSVTALGGTAFPKLNWSAPKDARRWSSGASPAAAASSASPSTRPPASIRRSSIAATRSSPLLRPSSPRS
uniref:Uncharacterized protein LOC109506461 n=2 Tax=Elaeis guineensis var. tenera TaxID=51953 RepID=A0A6J0PPS3_ELAGV